MGNLNCALNNDEDSEAEQKLKGLVKTSDQFEEALALENIQLSQTQDKLEPLRGTIIISVLNATNLVNLDTGGQGVSDPYVKVTATDPDGKQLIKLQTKTIDNNLNPIWNERMSVILDSEVQLINIRFVIWDEDPFSPHDSMGQIILPVNSNFPFDKDLNIKLKPRKEGEASQGSLKICLSYRPGEQIDLNQIHVERQEKKKNWKELPNEAKQNIKEWRLRKDVLTESEELKMALLARIFQSNFNTTSPVFAINIETQFMFSFSRAAWKVDSDDLATPKWFRKLDGRDGDFINESKDIIEEVCKFQSSKGESYRDGYMNDPEGLFCEEIKTWAAEQLSLIKIGTNAGDFIDKRIGYLEECLLVPDLFDRPSSLAKATIQQLILRVRQILKYRAMATIEKELSHEDASRCFADLKRLLSGLIRACFKFLNHVFRCESETLTNAHRLLLALQMDPNIKQVLGDELNTLRNSIKGIEALGEDAPWQTLDLREKGLKKTRDLMDPTMKDVKNPLLPFVFAGKDCGVEEWFRSNAFIALKFLRSHGLLLELGRLFVVIEKAANLAKTGGTLLVFGVGNAHLNATLDATTMILDEIKKEYNDVGKIAECCFEDLVFANMATKERTLWITQFKHVFPIMTEINKSIKELQKVVSDIKHTANSLSLYERFQKAAEEQSEFVNTAESFSVRMAEITGQPYKKPEPKKLTDEDTAAWKKLIGQ